MVLPPIVRDSNPSQTSNKTDTYLHVPVAVVGGLLSFAALLFVIIRVVRKRRNRLFPNPQCNRNQNYNDNTTISTDHLFNTSSGTISRESRQYRPRHHNLSVPPNVLNVPLRTVPRSTAENVSKSRRMPLSIADSELLIRSLQRKKDLCEKDSICSICLEEVENVITSKRVTLPCNHVYHTQCAITWFRKGAPLCPYCNYDLTPKIVEIRNMKRAQLDMEDEPRSAASSCSSEASWTSWGADSVGAQWLWAWWYGEDSTQNENIQQTRQ